VTASSGQPDLIDARSDGYDAERWRIGTIAKQLGVHHCTVERVLA
jgi:IS30 family transposase